VLAGIRREPGAKRVCKSALVKAAAAADNSRLRCNTCEATMADVLEQIDEALARWIAAQPVFFVATAPEGRDGYVNCSPKGGDSLRVLGPRSLAYLDVVGSGVETIAHLKENGRIVLMLCAFAGPPQIVRVHGRGAVVAPGDSEFADLLARFPPLPGVRAIVKVDAQRLSQSCGYGVPLMDFREPRTAMALWAEKKGPEGLLDYQRTRNTQSLDGLPGVDWLSSSGS
jgi:hypothetical protein